MNDEIQNLQKLPLHAQHEAAGATFGEEGNWQVPLSFTGSLAEAQQARQRAVIFDVSHLGRIRIRGDGALELLERVCTADVAHQEDDTAMHTLLCNQRGGIIDEGFLLRLENFWVLTTNAVNRRKVLEHLNGQDIASVHIDDQTAKVCQLAVAGPGAKEILAAVLPVSIEGLARGDARIGSLLIANYIAARSGYSDLWTLEVMLPTMFIVRAWQFITAKAGDNAIAPAGLAATDILRNEAGLCRYGHETNETIDPVTAGLMGCVDMGHDFIGAEAIAKIAAKAPPRRRVKLMLTQTDKIDPLPRQGETITDTTGRELGNVTSGSYSPQRQAGIAQAYVTADSAAVNTELLINHTPAQVVELF